MIEYIIQYTHEWCMESDSARALIALSASYKTYNLSAQAIVLHGDKDKAIETIISLLEKDLIRGFTSHNWR